MKVKDLIKVLKKMDQELHVVTKTHDEEEFEFDGRVTGVSSIDFEDEKNETYTKGMKGRVVVICT